MEKIAERREATDDVHKKGKPARVAVLFEVTPREEGHEEYLRLAGALKSELEGMPGFISAERFSSLKEGGKLLSLSLWENEEAAAEWRRRMNHRACQKRGREALFEQYRILVASVLREYTGEDRLQAPRDSSGSGSLKEP